MIVLLVGWAWHSRFIQDDAFISFRYAENLAHGNGLVWNVGERVAGYTNFLWTLAIAGGIRLGVDPVSLSMALGVVCFAGALILTYKLSLLVLRSRDLALLTIILLGTNNSFCSYATGGLETPLQTFLFVAGMYLLVRCIKLREWGARALTGLSIVLAAGVLTRPDSGALCVVLLTFALISILRTDRPARAKLAGVAALFGPLLVTVGAWAMFQLSYYGNLLPNTFYAKASHTGLAGPGLIYLGLFICVYWLAAYPVILALALRRILREANLGLMALLATLALWSAYVVKVGGDFMEFRFIVPVLPFAFIVVVWLACEFVRKRAITVILIALVLLGSLQYAALGPRLWYPLLGKYQIESVQALENHVNSCDGWGLLGEVLGDALRHDRRVSIAVTAAGAIPYYSELTSVDMLGLNDPWVARNGIKLPNFVGHYRFAPLSYLVTRKVNLVIGHPLTLTADVDTEEYLHGMEWRIYWFAITQPRIPDDASILEIPITPRHKLLVLYLTPSPLVDEAIQAHQWRRYPVPGRLSTGD